MTEHILRILLSELTTVRVRCRGQLQGRPCPGTVEAPIDQLGRVYADGQCPVCHALLQMPNDNALLRLSQVFGQLGRAGDRFELEFVLPVRPPQGS